MSEGGQRRAAVTLFYSYAHEDEPLRDELAGHLKILERRGLIQAWHDRKIVAGQDWATAIDTHLDRADLVLLLISKDFMESDYIFGVELQRAMQRQAQQRCAVVPIFVRAIDFDADDADDLPFLKLQGLPTDLKAVTSWPNRDEAWTNVAKGLRAAVKSVQALRPVVPPAPPAAIAPGPSWGQAGTLGSAPRDAPCGEAGTVGSAPPDGPEPGGAGSAPGSAGSAPPDGTAGVAAPDQDPASGVDAELRPRRLRHRAAGRRGRDRAQRAARGRRAACGRRRRDAPPDRPARAEAGALGRRPAREQPRGDGGAGQAADRGRRRGLDRRGPAAPGLRTRRRARRSTWSSPTGPVGRSRPTPPCRCWKRCAARDMLCRW